MHKVILISLIFFSCKVFSQKAENDSSLQKKYTIGIGFTYATSYYIIPGKPGFNFKADYLFAEELSFGLKSVFAPYQEGDWSSYTGDFHSDVHFSYDFNIGASVTYYLSGANQSRKGGIYTSIVIGYWREKISSSNYEYNPPPYSFYMEERTNGLMGMLSFGGDRKIGPGRIFLEGNLFANIFGQYYYHISSETNMILNNTFKRKAGSEFVNLYYFNLGYSFYLK